MPNRTHRTTDARGRAAIVLTLLALIATSARTTPAQDDAKPTPPPVTVDVERLLSDGMVFGSRISDDVYAITVPGDKLLVMIPLNPQAVSEDAEVDQFSVKLAAGRFLALYIPPTEGKSIPARRDVEFTGANDSVKVVLDVSPPRLTKECVLTADGKVKWSVPRTLFNSTLQSPKNAYVLQADPRKVLPPEQPRIARKPGEAPAAFIERRKTALEDYNRQRAEYMTTRKAISDLPDDFEEPAPPVIWAVYEASPLMRDFKLDGADPLPWKLEMDRFKAARDAVKTAPPSLAKIDEAVTQLMADDHAMSRQAASVVVTAGNAPTVIPADHALVDTIIKLIQEGDLKTRVRIATAFAAHAGRAPAAGRVLLAAAADPSPAVTFGALTARVAVAGETPDPALTAKVCESLNRLLPMAEAPPVEDLLSIAKALADKQPETADTLAADIDLSRVHPDRRDALVYHVLGLAATNSPIGERWLDRQLLGSSDARLRNQTMAKIVELTTPSGEAGSAAPKTPTYRIGSPDHAIVKLIAIDDNDVRKAAWAAAQGFRITTTTPEPSPVFGAVTDAALKRKPTPTGALTFMMVQPDAASARDQMARLLSEGDGPVRIGSLRQLATEGAEPFANRFASLTPEHRIDAARVWYGADPRPEPAIPVESIEPVLGLLTLTEAADPKKEGADPAAEAEPGDRPAQVVRWFAREIAAGRRPAPREWVKAMGGEQPLLSVLSTGEANQRKAAAAALVSQATWPTDPDITAAVKVADDVARTEPDATLRGPKLSGDWTAAKLRRAGQTLTDATGTHIVRIVVDAPRPEGAGPLTPTPEPTVTEIGRIAIAVSPAPDKPDQYAVVANPEAVAMESTTDPVTLTIVDGLSLNQLADGKLDTQSALAKGPIALSPAANGGWAGDAKRALGGTVRVELVPVE